MSKYRSKAENSIILVKGSNRIIDNVELAFSEENLLKRYNAECASGFYLIEDEDVAKKYAYEIAEKYGGVPILNLYRVRVADIKEELKTSFSMS